MDFLQEYFIVPLMRNGWFNPLNSLVYGVVLILGVWFVFSLLKKLKISPDKKLLLSIIPFIAFAGVTRTLRDYIYFPLTGSDGFFTSFPEHIGIMQESAYNYIFSVTGNQPLAYIDSFIVAWFPTPGSYFITFSLALASLFVSLIVQKYLKIPYWKTMFAAGFILFLGNASLLPVNSFTPLLYIGAVSIGWAALFFGLTFLSGTKKIEKINIKAANLLKKVFTKMNSSILTAHFFDATATFFALAMFSTMAGHGYDEQHFLSRWLIPFLGPQVMFLLKFIVVVPVIYFIDKYVEEKDFRNFLLIVVFILGMAPATRNLARLMVGV